MAEGRCPVALNVNVWGAKAAPTQHQPAHYAMNVGKDASKLGGNLSTNGALLINEDTGNNTEAGGN